MNAASYLLFLILMFHVVGVQLVVSCRIFLMKSLPPLPLNALVLLVSHFPKQHVPDGEEDEHNNKGEHHSNLVASARAGMVGILGCMGVLCHSVGLLETLNWCFWAV